MRILLVSAVPPPTGGIATWTLKYLDFCKKNNIKVDLVNTALNGKRGKKINSKRSISDEVSRSLHIFANMKKMLKENPDIVHINSSCSTFGIIRDYICVQMAKRQRIPVCIHCHCNIKDQVQKTYGIKILKKIFSDVSQVLVLNKNSFEYARELGATNLTIVPNFIEKQMLVESHDIKKNIENVVFVGHVQPSKGCKEIFNVAIRLPEIHFQLVGPVNDEILSLECPANVTLEGECRLDRIKDILSAADVYLFPSHTEGFSLSLTEAMANGLPCIATNVGANSDMLEGLGGVIVPIKDENSIIEAFDRIGSQEIRSRMSAWNINKVKNTYILEKVMTTLFKLYEKELVN